MLTAISEPGNMRWSGRYSYLINYGDNKEEEDNDCLWKSARRLNWFYREHEPYASLYDCTVRTECVSDALNWSYGNAKKCAVTGDGTSVMSVTLKQRVHVTWYF
jgi:hypothetical protein